MPGNVWDKCKETVRIVTCEACDTCGKALQHTTAILDNLNDVLLCSEKCWTDHCAEVDAEIESRDHALNSMYY